MGAKEKHSTTKDLLKEDSEKGLLKLSSVWSRKTVVWNQDVPTSGELLGCQEEYFLTMVALLTNVFIKVPAQILDKDPLRPS